MPVDVAAKANALALIAAAFNRGDLAMAAIATVQMQFPDPPLLTKGRETEDEVARRALELHRSRLLKFWDPAKHPRTGTPPNPGWFAPESGGTEGSPVIPAASRLWPWNWLPRKKPFAPGGPTPPPGTVGIPLPGAGIPKLPQPPAAAPARPAAPPGGSLEPEPAAAPRSAGRLGGPATRAQNAAIAAQLENEGFTIINGGATLPGEYIHGAGPGTKGGTYVDITAINNQTGEVVRVQTVDTLADGTPTPRESAAAARIRSRFPNDRLILIPKRRAQ